MTDTPKGKPSIYKVLDETGTPLDSDYELGDGFIVLHSSTGKKTGLAGTNTDYAKALHEILKRLLGSGLIVSDALVDSKRKRFQEMPKDQRRIMNLNERHTDAKAFAKSMLQRMPNVGSERAAGGNARRRIRIEVQNASSAKLRSVLGETLALEIDALPLPADDLGWREGGLIYVTHLRRERADGLAEKKREAFIKTHGGRIFCELCRFDPLAAYGEFGAACIEVHHAKVAVENMEDGHVTKLEDLQCLCANCHRVTHKHMRERDALPFEGSTAIRPIVSALGV
jgi:predicted HNH restriction endonuclease